MGDIQGQADLFIKSYWNYYMELEAQLVETKRYVEFDAQNGKTFSIEYLKLYQAVCSEIDVVGKEIVACLCPDFKANSKANIQKWGYEMQQLFPRIKDNIVCFYKAIEIQPFRNWEYEKYLDKRGQERFRIVKKKKAIPWWGNYNKVKHQRIGLVTGIENFKLANQKNLVTALSALYLMEYTYLQYLEEHGASFHDHNPSRIFQLKQTIFL